MQTYNPKKISVAFGTKIVTGFAEDSFVSIEPTGDGVTKKVGCDGEVIRSISPDETYAVKIVVFQNSSINGWLEKKLAKDRSNGSGMFPITIKDNAGTMVFNSKYSWPVKSAARQYGKEAGTREWEIHTGAATLTE